MTRKTWLVEITRFIAMLACIAACVAVMYHAIH